MKCPSKDDSGSSLLPYFQGIVCFLFLCTLLGGPCNGEDNPKYSVRHCNVSDAFPEMIRINGINVQKIHEWNLKRAHNYSLRIDFKVHFAATKVFLQLMLQIGGNSVRLPFFRKDLCQTNSGLQCPLFQNERYHFKLKVGIPEQTPKVDGRLRMRLINEHGQILLCSIFPLTVVD